VLLDVVGGRVDRLASLQRDLDERDLERGREARGGPDLDLALDAGLGCQRSFLLVVRLTHVADIPG
jgi:hypothetical protein